MGFIKVLLGTMYKEELRKCFENIEQIGKIYTNMGYVLLVQIHEYKSTSYKFKVTSY